MTLYYDDLEVGQTYTLPTRTVMETDLVSFAMLSGDWNEIHTDAVFAESTVHGRRMALGLLGIAVMVRLASEAAEVPG